MLDRLPRFPPAWLGALLLVFATSCGRTDAPPPVRNVILFVVDTLRADRLHCYGYPRDITPNIDRLAEMGTLYENVRPQGSNTRYSMLSMLSGLYVTTEEERMPKGHPTLAERVRETGRLTSAFIGNVTLVRGTRGFDRGFDHVEGAEIAGRDDKIDGDAGAMVSKFRMWYEASQERIADSPGFFSWIHVMDPHIPYVATPDDRRAAAGPLPMEDFLRQTWESTPGPFLSYLDERQRNRLEEAEQDMLRTNQLYDAELVGLDHSVGALLKYLDRKGELDDTLIVFASDHGELLYERLKYPEEIRSWFRRVRDPSRRTLEELHFCGHGWSFHEPQWRTPLILVGPGIPAGARQTGLVANLDIYPTVLEACGIPVPPNLPGYSLYGGTDGRHKEVFAYSLHTSAVIDHRGWKYVDRRDRLREMLEPEDVDPEADGPAIELYNLAEDPLEQNNLYEKLPKEAEYFAKLIERWRREHAREVDTTLTEADIEALRQLGYVGDDAHSR